MLAMFNQNAPVIGNSIEEPSQDAIENTLNLRQVSLEDAARYGGEVTRAALGAMNLKGDRKHIIVDTKVHMLMKGFIPAIPGWHTDGVPRGAERNPAGSGDPDIEAQINHNQLDISAPRYHLLVTGSHCPTRFLANPLTLDVDNGRNLYAFMSKYINTLNMLSPSHFDYLDTPASTVVEWDWWNIHCAQIATGRGWRYLIRVTETDHIEPRTNPADFIRTQNQVYVPTEFGW